MEARKRLGGFFSATSNPLAVQAFLDNFFKHGHRDKEAETHADGADSAGVDPAVEGGA
jgi:hypothetical protein